MPDAFTLYQYTEDGELIDPPALPEYERQLREAQAGGDQAQISVLSDEYAEARQKVAEKHNEMVETRRQEDERLLAQSREAQAEEQKRRESQEEAERERAEIDRLRAEGNNL